MFLGHFALGFAAKRVAPRTSLTLLIVATTLLDILWPLLLLVGLESVRIVPGITAMTPLDFVSYPYSHSLLMVLLWGVLLGGLYFARTRYVAGALTLGALVVSHWVLDWISHRPDMPLAPGLATRVGLGLWDSVAATMAVEAAMFAAGLALYLSATRARGVMGHVSLWLLVALLAFGASDRATPPSVGVLIGFSLGVTVLTLAMLVWIDRTRTSRASRGA